MYVGVVVVIIQVAHPLTHSLTHIRRQGRTEINCNRAGINIIPITDRKVAREAKDYQRDVNDVHEECETYLLGSRPCAGAAPQWWWALRRMRRAVLCNSWAGRSHADG